jgi:hypothetical protein
MNDGDFPLKPTRMRTHPHTTRSRLMLEIASALVNRRDWDLLQARISLREQGSEDWPLRSSAATVRRPSTKSPPARFNSP